MIGGYYSTYDFPGNGTVADGPPPALLYPPTWCIISAFASALFPGVLPSPDTMAAPVFFNRSPIFAERPETALLVVFCQT